MKVLNRVQREYEQAMASTTSTSSNTLPRNAFSALDQDKLASILQTSVANVAASNSQNNHNGRHSSLERSKTLGPGIMRGHQPSLDPTGYISPLDTGSFEHLQQGNVMVPSRFSAWPENGRYYPRPESTEEAKARMMHMESQLSQLTGMVEKALKNKKLGKKTVSFDKSVTYSDDPQPQPQGILVTAKNKASGSAGIVSTSVPSGVVVPQHRCSSATPVSSSNTMMVPCDQPNDTSVNLKRLHKNAKELKQEVRVLRRLTQLQSMAMKDLVQDTYIKLREACISFSTNQNNAPLMANYDPELWRLVSDEETFVKELNELVQSICQLEAKVEETRSGVINKKNKISLVDVESMAYTLSKCSKTVTMLKQAFPTLEANIKAKSNNDGNPEKRRMTEDFLKRTPDRMENIWRRCKKLTGTLVTLKRLASVQEQRFHPGANIEMSLSPTPSEMSSSRQHQVSTPAPIGTPSSNGGSDTLKTPSEPQPIVTGNGNPIASPNRRKARPSSSEIKEHTIPSDPPVSNGVSTGSLEKQKTAPPPPPPRSSSAFKAEDNPSNPLEGEVQKKEPPPVAAKPSNVDIKSLTAKARQDALEQRHQELLNRQKQLQEQYQRLQNMQKSKSLTSNGGGGSSTSSLSSTSSSVSTTAELKPKEPVVTPMNTSENHENNGQTTAAPQTTKKPIPPAVPMRTNSSLTANADNRIKDNSNQKIYHSDII